MITNGRWMDMTSEQRNQVLLWFEERTGEVLDEQTESVIATLFNAIHDAGHAIAPRDAVDANQANVERPSDRQALDMVRQNVVRDLTDRPTNEQHPVVEDIRLTVSEHFSEHSSMWREVGQIMIDRAALAYYISRDLDVVRLSRRLDDFIAHDSPRSARLYLAGTMLATMNHLVSEGPLQPRDEDESLASAYMQRYRRIIQGDSSNSEPILWQRQHHGDQDPSSDGEVPVSDQHEPF